MDNGPNASAMISQILGVQTDAQDLWTQAGMSFIVKTLTPQAMNCYEPVSPLPKAAWEGTR
ncbi:MAG: hypothetical protein C7B44_00500 [Sulfobacillus thermosulfidooxidans]|nr:MAG: hypothetical protein C7B44_00500 [Sulfobacillus thermosulfidooxidans]